MATGFEDLGAIEEPKSQPHGFEDLGAVAETTSPKPTSSPAAQGDTAAFADLGAVTPQQNFQRVSAQEGFDPAAHLADNPDDIEAATDWEIARRAKPVTMAGALDATGRFLQGAGTGIVEGVPSMVRGFVKGAANIAQNVAAGFQGRGIEDPEVARRKLENAAAVRLGTLSLGKMGESAADKAERLWEWAPGTEDTTREDVRQHLAAQADYLRRMKSAGRGELPTDNGGGNAFERAFYGEQRKPAMTPEQTAQFERNIEDISEGPGDITNIPILGAALAPPKIVARTAGKALELGGKAVEKTGTVAANAAERIAKGKIAHASPWVAAGDIAFGGGAHTATIAGTAAATGAGWVGGKFAQNVGRMAKEAGQELGGGFAPVNQPFYRKAIKSGMGGAAVGTVASAPMMLGAESAEEAGAMMAPGTVLGATTGLLHPGARATEGRAQFGETVRHGQAVNYGDNRENVIAMLSPDDQTVLHFWRGHFDGATTPDGQPIRVNPLTAAEFAAKYGQESAGVFDPKTGHLDINVESGRGIANIFAHEGKHALDEAMKASQPQLYKDVFDAIKRRFTTGDGKTATPEFLEWIQGQMQLHMNNLQAAGATPEQINAAMADLGDMSYWINEASADIGQGLITGADLGSFMMPQSLISRVWDGVKDAAAKRGINIPDPTDVTSGAIGLPSAQAATRAIRRQLYAQGQEAARRRDAKATQGGTVGARIAELTPIAGRPITAETPMEEREEIRKAQRELAELQKDIGQAAPEAEAPSPITPADTRAAAVELLREAGIEKPNVALNEAQRRNPEVAGMEADALVAYVQALAAEKQAIADAQSALTGPAYKWKPTEARQSIAAVIAQHGEPVTDAGKLVLAAARVKRGGKVEAGEFNRPDVPTARAGTTFNGPADANGAQMTHTVTGSAAREAQPGEFILTREGRIARVVKLSVGGTGVEVVGPFVTDTTTTTPAPHGTYAVLTTTAAPKAATPPSPAQESKPPTPAPAQAATPAPAAGEPSPQSQETPSGTPQGTPAAIPGLDPTPGAGTPEPDVPERRVVPFGQEFIIIDRADNPINKRTYKSKSSALAAIRQMEAGGQRFTLPPPLKDDDGNDIPDILDAIGEQGGIYFGNLSKEEKENFIRDKYLRTILSSGNPDNTPDEIARLLAPSEGNPEGYGDGSMSELPNLIRNAYEARKRGKIQDAARQRQEKSNAPEPSPEPAPEPPTGEPIPPRAGSAVAVSVAPADRPQPTPLRLDEIEQVAASAKAKTIGDAFSVPNGDGTATDYAVHPDTYTNSKGKTKKWRAGVKGEVQAWEAENAGRKSISKAEASEIRRKHEIMSVIRAHSDRMPLNHEGIRLRTDPFGRETVSGKLDEGSDFDNWLLNQSSLAGKWDSIGNLLTLQNSIGKTLQIDYGHAPTGEGVTTADARRAGIAKSTAEDRARGEAPMEIARKTIVPLEIQYNPGTESFTVLGASPEKLLSNWTHLQEAYSVLGEPMPYRDIHDPRLVADMKGYVRNHQNNRQGDGSTMKGKQGERIEPTGPAYPIAEAQFEFLNALMGDESAKSETKQGEAKASLAQFNDRMVNAQAGETNPLRERINAKMREKFGEWPVTDENGNPVPGRFTTWTKGNIENPLSEALRPDLIQAIHPETTRDDASIRPAGYKGDVGRFLGAGIPERGRVAAGFMPEDASTAGAEGKTKARAAQLWKEKGTESPFFKKWFGASKVVDERGKPQPAYHGTTKAGFTEFDPNRQMRDSGWYGRGSYFTLRPSEVNGYTADYAGRVPQTAGVYKVFLKIENPLRVENRNDMANQIQKLGGNPNLEGKELSAEIQRLGFDGVITNDGGEAVIFDPKQVKSATGNTGEFDAKNPDIRFMPEEKEKEIAERMAKKILAHPEIGSVFNSEGMDEEAADIAHKHPEDAAHILDAKRIMDEGRENILKARSVSELKALVEHHAGKEYEKTLNELLEKAKHEAGIRPEAPGIPRTNPEDVLRSPDLSDQLLDKWKEYQNTGDPKLLETIKQWSSHFLPEDPRDRARTRIEDRRRAENELRRRLGPAYGSLTPQEREQEMQALLRRPSRGARFMPNEKNPASKFRGGEDFTAFWMRPDDVIDKADDGHVLHAAEVLRKRGMKVTDEQIDAANDGEDDAIYNEMYKAGYLRVTLERGGYGKPVLYVNGKPSVSQKRELNNLVIENRWEKGSKSFMPEEGIGGYADPRFDIPKDEIDRITNAANRIVRRENPTLSDESDAYREKVESIISHEAVVWAQENPRQSSDRRGVMSDGYTVRQIDAKMAGKLNSEEGAWWLFDADGSEIVQVGVPHNTEQEAIKQAIEQAKEMGGMEVGTFDEATPQTNEEIQAAIGRLGDRAVREGREYTPAEEAERTRLYALLNRQSAGSASPAPGELPPEQASPAQQWLDHHPDENWMATRATGAEEGQWQVEDQSADTNIGRRLFPNRDQAEAYADAMNTGNFDWVVNAGGREMARFAANDFSRATVMAAENNPGTTTITREISNGSARPPQTAEAGRGLSGLEHERLTLADIETEYVRNGLYRAFYRGSMVAEAQGQGEAQRRGRDNAERWLRDMTPEERRRAMAPGTGRQAATPRMTEAQINAQWDNLIDRVRRELGPRDGLDARLRNAWNRINGEIAPEYESEGRMGEMIQEALEGTIPAVNERIARAEKMARTGRAPWNPAVVLTAEQVGTSLNEVERLTAVRNRLEAQARSSMPRLPQPRGTLSDRSPLANLHTDLDGKIVEQQKGIEDEIKALTEQIDEYGPPSGVGYGLRYNSRDMVFDVFRRDTNETVESFPTDREANQWIHNRPASDAASDVEVRAQRAELEEFRRSLVEDHAGLNSLRESLRLANPTTLTEYPRAFAEIRRLEVRGLISHEAKERAYDALSDRQNTEIARQIIAEEEARPERERRGRIDAKIRAGQREAQQQRMQAQSVWDDLLQAKDAKNLPKVAKLWQQVSRSDEAFAYGRTKATDPSEIAKDMSTPGHEITSEQRGPRSDIWFRSGNGSIYIDDPMGHAQIGASSAGSRGKKEGGGSQLYQAAFAWAHNNGKVIHPSNALSTINAYVRRTSNMLSSALRFGTTRHMIPDNAQGVKNWQESKPTYQVEFKDEDSGKRIRLMDDRGDSVLSFATRIEALKAIRDYGASIAAPSVEIIPGGSDKTIDAHNIAQLAMRESEQVLKAVPALQRVDFDFKTGKMRADGKDITPADLSQMLEQAGKANTYEKGIGLSTAQRAIITASAIREADGGQLARADGRRGVRLVKEQKRLLYMPEDAAVMDRIRKDFSRWNFNYGRHGKATTMEEAAEFLGHSEEQMAALNAYMSGGFTEMSQNPDHPVTQALVKLLKRIPSVQVPEIHRALGFMTPEDRDAYLQKIGAEGATAKQERAITSWTTHDPRKPGLKPHQNIALEMAEGGGEYTVILTVKNPTNAKDISFGYTPDTFGGMIGTNEVLLPPGTKMKVESIRRQGDQVHVEMAPSRAQETGSFMPEDTGQPGESNIPAENLAREAEAAGINLSLETLKRLTRGDQVAMNAVRRRIEEQTGRAARFMPEGQGRGEDRRKIAESWKGSPTMEAAKPGDDYNGWVEAKQEILHTISTPEGWSKEDESYHTKWGTAYLYLQNADTGETIKVRIGDHPASRDRAADNDLSFHVPKNATLHEWANIADKVEKKLAEFADDPRFMPEDAENARDIVPAIRINGTLTKGQKGDTHQDILNRHMEANPDDVDALMNFDSKANPNLFIGPDGQEISREQLKERFGVRDSQGLKRIQEGQSFMPEDEPQTPQARARARQNSREAAAARQREEIDWDRLNEDLTDNLDSFNPARDTGRRNYELDDMANRFVDYAKANQSGKPLTELVKDFAKQDEASPAQLRKLKAAVKEVDSTRQRERQHSVQIGDAGMTDGPQLDSLESTAASRGAATTSAMPATSNKSLADSMAAHAKPLAQLAIANPTIIKRLGEGDVVARRDVLPMVRGLLQNLQVAKTVVGLVPVEMMDVLTGSETATKRLLHDPAMLVDLLSADPDNAIPSRVQAIDKLAAMLTRSAAKVASGSGDVAASKFLAALRTGESEHAGKIPQPRTESKNGEPVTPAERREAMGEQRFMPEDEPSVASLRDEFKRTSLISTGTARKILGDKPDYLDAVADFMGKQRQKTVNGALTKRDVAKAYLLTLGSIGAGGISPETFTAKTGMKIPKRYLSIEAGNRRIRPEEAVALWMGTPDGKAALDAIDAGNATPEHLDGLLKMRDAFGRNDIRNNALRVGGNQRTLANIAKVTSEINAAKGDVDKIGAALQSLTGIAGGKIGFIKHLLGLGDTSTVDAVELNFWLTGKGSTRQQEGKRETLVRNLKEFGLKNPAISKLVTDRIGAQVTRLAKQYDLDPAVASHIMHHWLWDAAKDAQTTHKGMMEAQARFMPDESAPQPPERPARGTKLPDVMAYGRERRAWIDRFVAWSEKQPRNKPIVLADGDDRTGVITPAIGGGYRITRYLNIDGKQVPHGHMEFQTREEAVRDALTSDGFKSGSDRRFMPESSPQAPRQRPDPRSAARARIAARTQQERPERELATAN